MKKTINKEVQICDKCTKEAYVYPCLGCGIEMCYECLEVYGKRYLHGVYFSGSGDGEYCTACDLKLTASRSDKRHNAYRVIESLRLESKAWGEDFKRRQEEAEAALNQL